MSFARPAPLLLAYLGALASIAAALGCARAAEEPPTAPPQATAAAVDASPTPPTATPLPALVVAPPALEGDSELLRVADPWHALPEGYAPADLVTLPSSAGAPGYGAFELRREAAIGLTVLLEGAQAAGHDLRVVSAFRSYDAQVAIFERRTAAVGEERASRGSARPGHSEHQLGTTVDLSSAEVDWRLTQRFGETAAGRWLAEEGVAHGWALSYPAGAEVITGYQYEPWHARYLGVTHAERWRRSGLTITEYLQSIGGPTASRR